MTAGKAELGPNQEGVVESEVLAPDQSPRWRARPRSPPSRRRRPRPPPRLPPRCPRRRRPRCAEPVPTTEPPRPPSNRTGGDPHQDPRRPLDQGTPHTRGPEAGLHRWNGGAKLRWSAYQGPDFAAYLVLRATAPDEPVYPVAGPPSGRTAITDPAMTGYWDQVDDPGGQACRVVAMDRDGACWASAPWCDPPFPSRRPRPTRPPPPPTGVLMVSPPGRDGPLGGHVPEHGVVELGRGLEHEAVAGAGRTFSVAPRISPASSRVGRRIIVLAALTTSVGAEMAPSAARASSLAMARMASTWARKAWAAGKR